jgi:hypothetical protein
MPRNRLENVIPKPEMRHFNKLQRYGLGECTIRDTPTFFDGGFLRIYISWDGCRYLPHPRPDGSAVVAGMNEKRGSILNNG